MNKQRKHRETRPEWVVFAVNAAAVVSCLVIWGIIGWAVAEGL